MKPFSVIDLVVCALCAALTAVCAWISIPVGQVPITLQTFAIFLTLSLLGGRRGIIAVAVYILLGAVGVPIFAGMKGGLGVLAGPTGGYILGFLGSALVYWLMEIFLPQHFVIRIAGMIVGNLVCYGFGTAWFIIMMNSRGKAMDLVTALGMCVIPYVLPDLVKIFLADVLARRIRPALRFL